MIKIILSYILVFGISCDDLSGQNYLISENLNYRLPELLTSNSEQTINTKEKWQNI